MHSESDEAKIQATTQILSRLNECADELRAEVASLRQELIELQQQCSMLRSSQLMEANERLVLAAIHAETIAEQAISDLGAMAYSNRHDSLTGLPNRLLMLDRFESAIAMARRRSVRCAVLFIDLDHFKDINDTLGHAVGDVVLQQVARCLQAVVRDSDTVSRHGGDEFLVLLAEVRQASDASLIATKMLRALAAEHRLGEHVLQLSASIGIALYPNDGKDADTLISRADAAMYRCKQEAGGKFRLYEKPEL